MIRCVSDLENGNAGNLQGIRTALCFPRALSALDR